MSKKTKRSSRSSPVRSSPPIPVAETVQTSPVSPLSARRSERGFNPDYSDVIKDLKRIGTLAGAFFLIMIVLSFFLK
ncbi:MAG: hypothetical protein RML93_12720 [Anaerolineales bacterium]|nr:hypothetical protein [Anaerolineales bacterium]MCS7248237.1 hypothetical protein [Anaerolineales bacterium]MDW8162050.1 hypothetical protein [Anaerolineales bacterium]MDW8448138.1 hypothetical protein [Anaerolineales bacterium]